jgi:hypothetical protein
MMICSAHALLTLDVRATYEPACVGVRVSGDRRHEHVCRGSGRLVAEAA